MAAYAPLSSPVNEFDVMALELEKRGNGSTAICAADTREAGNTLALFYRSRVYTKKMVLGRIWLPPPGRSCHAKARIVVRSPIRDTAMLRSGRLSRQRCRPGAAALQLDVGQEVVGVAQLARSGTAFVYGTMAS